MIDVRITMRLENDQVGNTWFQNVDNSPDFEGPQLHMSKELFIALGKPQEITVFVRPEAP